MYRYLADIFSAIADVLQPWQRQACSHQNLFLVGKLVEKCPYTSTTSALELQQCNHIGGASNYKEKESNNKCCHDILTGHIRALETQVIDFKNIEATQTR
jgi:hypothetical protein